MRDNASQPLPPAIPACQDPRDPPSAVMERVVERVWEVPAAADCSSVGGDTASFPGALGFTRSASWQVHVSRLTPKTEAQRTITRILFTTGATMQTAHRVSAHGPNPAGHR